MRKIPSGIICLVCVVTVFGYFGCVMGFANMLNTIMHTAHDLLLNTVFYLMAMCVITGALSKILMEFGVVDLLQKLLRPIMRPLFHLPGAASVVALVTFLSDRPAAIGLIQDPKLARQLSRTEQASLVNFGGCFSMGMLVIVFMVGHGFYWEPFLGLAGAVVGAVVSTWLMQRMSASVASKRAKVDPSCNEVANLLPSDSDDDTDSLFVRVLNAILAGGKTGVDIGLAVIPGVLIISTLVMMLTFGGNAEGVYTGAAYQGTRLLPWLAGQIGFLFHWLFGFSAPELVAFPMTALGAVGAALGLIPEFIRTGIIDSNAIAVFTAMGMCWSGFLSVDAASMATLGYRELVSKSFICTLVGGVTAGVVTHWMYVLITLFV